MSISMYLSIHTRRTNIHPFLKYNLTFMILSYQSVGLKQVPIPIGTFMTTKAKKKHTNPKVHNLTNV